MKHFIPVKITDKKWADKLVRGEVYMRPLHDFGIWGNINEKDAVLKNDFRGDLYSGVTATYASPDDSKFFSGFSEALQSSMHNCCLIDEGDAQFFKIYSLYCYELDDEMQTFKTPDSRMEQFGDTAVIIIDFCEFLERYAKALFSLYEPLISLVDHVQFFDFTETQFLNPLFCKINNQAYQNELRLAFCQLEPHKNMMNSMNENKFSLVRELSPVLLKLGDISDITVEIPIKDFLACKLPKDFKCRWPSNNDPSNPSNFDNIIHTTRAQMQEFKCSLTKPAFTIC